MKSLKESFGSIIVNLLSKLNLGLVDYNKPERKQVNILINEIKKETELMLSNTEAQLLYYCVKASLKIEGDLAEVGVYMGGSSKIICEVKGNRPLHLFDTFKGFPRPTQNDDNDRFWEGKMPSLLEDVKLLLAKYPNIFYYPGLFPNTARPIENIKFSFVNLDVDLYESTRSCLEFFYPRMNHGGVILSHDYSELIGVKKAFDEFFIDKNEIVLEFPGSQCLVIKT